MLIERKIISRILDEGYSRAIENNVTSDLFITSINMLAFNFVREYYSEYGVTPPLERLLAKISDFEYFDTEEVISALVNELIEEKQKVLVKDILFESARILQDEQENPYDFLIQEMQKIPVQARSDIDVVRFDEFDVQEYYNYDRTFLPTGLVELDRLLDGGIRGRGLVYLVSRPFVGKSAIMKYCVYQQAKQKYNVIIITSEEDPHTVAIEIACFRANINPNKYLHKKISQEELQEITDIVEDFKDKKNNINIIYSSNITPQFIVEQIKKYKADIFWIDSFSAMNSDTRIHARTERFENIARGLEKVTKGNNVVGFILHHLTRDEQYISYTDEVNRCADVIFWVSTNDTLSSENKRLLKIEKLRGDTPYKFSCNGEPTNSAIINWDFENINFDIVYGVDTLSGSGEEILSVDSSDFLDDTL